MEKVFYVIVEELICYYLEGLVGLGVGEVFCLGVFVEEGALDTYH